MDHSNYFILSTTESGNVHLTDVDSGEPIKTIRHKSQNPRMPEIHRAKYNEKDQSLGYSCMDGTVCQYSDPDQNCPSFEAKLPGSCQDFDSAPENMIATDSSDQN